MTYFDVLTAEFLDEEIDDEALSVTLTPAQIEEGMAVALKRQHNAHVQGRDPGTAPTSWNGALRLHQLGAPGELAASTFFPGLQWHAYQEGDLTGLADIGDFIDVKTVDHPGKRLLVQEAAQPDWAYLLVDASARPTYRLVGWDWGWRLKVPKYHDDPLGFRPAFFVPRRVLRPAWELIDLARRRS